MYSCCHLQWQYSWIITAIQVDAFDLSLLVNILRVSDAIVAQPCLALRTDFREATRISNSPSPRFYSISPPLRYFPVYRSVQARQVSLFQRFNYAARTVRCAVLHICCAECYGISCTRGENRMTKKGTSWFSASKHNFQQLFRASLSPDFDILFPCRFAPWLLRSQRLFSYRHVATSLVQRLEVVFGHVPTYSHSSLKITQYYSHMNLPGEMHSLRPPPTNRASKGDPYHRHFQETQSQHTTMDVSPFDYSGDFDSAFSGTGTSLIKRC